MTAPAGHPADETAHPDKTSAEEAARATPSGDDAVPATPSGDDAVPATPSGDDAVPATPSGDDAVPATPSGDGAVHVSHTWDGARQSAFDCAAPIPAAPVPRREAPGRTLAEDITAVQDMPHYASSAMDGWAVNGSGPWIIAEPGQRLAPHQASVIVTGGLLPPGAKAVLRSESGVMATDDEGLPVLALGGSARPGEPRNGQHIRKAAEEADAGEVLVKAGTVLNPAHVALAALAGYDTVQVLGKPVVKLLLTGSEVVEHGLPEPGKVRDTFGPQLAGVV